MPAIYETVKIETCSHDVKMDAKRKREKRIIAFRGNIFKHYNTGVSCVKARGRKERRNADDIYTF